MSIAAPVSAASQRVTNHHVTVDGVRLHALRAGHGRPLLLLHGLVGSARNWRQNIESLAQHATVYALDLPNMGQSGRIFGLDASLEATADLLARWMQVSGIDQADIAAHSHGGAVAMMLAARHPGRVGRLILFAPANPFCDLGRPLIAFYNTGPGKWLASLIPVLPRFVKSIALGRMYGNPALATRESLEGYTDGLATPGSVGHVLQIVRRWHDDMTQLRLSLPNLVEKQVLLVWGDRDRAVGLASATQLQQQLPNSQIYIVPGVGHIAFEESPAICNRVMRQWLYDSSQTAPVLAPRHHPETLRQLEAI